MSRLLNRPLERGNMATRDEEMEASTVVVMNVSVTSLVNNSGASSMPNPSLPRVTTSQSPEYCHKLADITSRASLTDPLNIIFQQEKTGKATPVTPGLLYQASKRRIETKISAGASVVEAGDFAAVACWEAPLANPPSFTDAELEEIACERPVFAAFVRDIQAARIECLGAHQPYWTLSLMARDPERKDKGAVRAVIEPYVRQAKEQRVPLWLVAGNPRARDVYAYFGFRVVQAIWSYPTQREDGDEDGRGGVPTWCMVCNWPVGEGDG